jgi:hypothetical protein
MGYKFLGYIVWTGTKWYMRRRVEFGTGKKVAAVGVAGAAITGAIVAGRQASAARSGS